MAKFPLTDEQVAVVKRIEGNFAVLAAAGSGKTTVLAERYLALVLEYGYRPSQILTVTFTKKAAAEMKKRIVERLQERGEFEAAQEAETGPIQTIHSFCERVLRENSIEAGLDPQFEVVPDLDGARLKTDSVRKAIYEALADTPEASRIVGDMVGKTKSGDPRNYSLLKKLVLDVVEQFRGFGWTRAELHAKYGSAKLTQQVLEDAMMSTLPEAARVAIKENPHQHWVTSARASFGKRVPSAYKWLISATEDELTRSYEAASGLMQLALMAWNFYEDELRSHDWIDMDQQVILAVNLIENSEVVRARLRRQYPVVMVDESQDNSPLQFRLMHAINAPSTMFVGDDQQSIYGFRHADVQSFRKVAANQQMLLSKNHRSQPGILNFVDAVFGNLWGEHYRPTQLAEFDFESLSQVSLDGISVVELEANFSAAAVADQVDALISEGHRFADIAVLVRTSIPGEAIQQELMKRGIGTRTAFNGGKFYSKLEIRDLANTLAALSDPSDRLALLAMLRSPMVGLNMDAIVSLARDPDPVERLTIGSNEWTEDDRERARECGEWFKVLRTLIPRLTACEAITEILHRTPFLENLARREDRRQMLANVRKLLTMAAAMPELTGTEFAMLIREIVEMRRTESDASIVDEDADLVTISTVHRAKGLEWPIVILPDTSDYKPRKAKELMLDAANGLLAIKLGTVETPAYAFLKQRVRELDENEEQRKFYVAVTRAKQKLLLFKNAKSLGAMRWVNSAVPDLPVVAMAARNQSVRESKPAYDDGDEFDRFG